MKKRCVKCWQQNKKYPGALAYCPLPKGHTGPHSWELLPWEWLTLVSILLGVLTFSGCSMQVCTTYLIPPAAFGITAPTTSCVEKP